VSDAAQTAEQDARQLKALGYTSHFDRTMSIWVELLAGVPPTCPRVVGVYTLFCDVPFQPAGRRSYGPTCLIGLAQLLVCLVFGEIVSQFPILRAGLYPWAGGAWSASAGPGWPDWVYVWALVGHGWRRVATGGGARSFATLIGVGHQPGRHDRDRGGDDRGGAVDET